MRDPQAAAIDFRRAVDSHVFEDLSEFYWARACEMMKDYESASIHFNTALQRGFAFRDLVDGKGFLRKRLDSDSGRVGRHGTVELLDRIRLRNKILTQEEEGIARKRMAAILPLEKFQEEYRTLYSMFIVLDNEQMDLLLWDREVMILP